MDFKNIKNFIFDLGGVIININPVLSYQAFAQIAGNEHTHIHNEFNRLQLFQRFELGEFEDSAFRDFMKSNMNLNCSDDDFLLAWNKLLLDIPAERVELVKKINNNYRSFLLSNTNAIHIPAVEEILHQSTGVKSLDELFEKTYYSYRIKKSKPFAESFKFVLDENNLKAEETVFIDDSLANIEGAKAVGLHTIHVQTPLTILDYLKDA